jgi:hypothetical protein
MDRRVVWLLVGVGMTVGDLLPAAWGGSAFGLASLTLAGLGGVVGLWFAAKMAG